MKYCMSHFNHNIEHVWKCSHCILIPFTLKLASLFLAFGGLLSKVDSAHGLFCAEVLMSGTLEAGWLFAAHWPFGLCPVLSSKVMERTAKLVGCGLASGFSLEEVVGCTYRA